VHVDHRDIAHLDVTGPVDLAWARRFRDEVRALRDDPAGARVVVLSSRGRAFGVGGDVSLMRGGGDVRGAVQELADVAHEGFHDLITLPLPVVCRVQGVAAGLALSLVLACDVVIAARSATFTTAYTAIGISPDGGMSWTLPRIVGHRRAFELLASARRFDADEAQRLGVVTEAVEDDALDDAVAAVTGRLAAAPTAALGQVKRLLLRAPASDLATHLADEARTVADLAAGPTGTEGIAAFLERRSPRFP
jgi:2-(1,2-epoxy-1,2-dihydrophenyl)acetyl-CoA isomerase